MPWSGDIVHTLLAQSVSTCFLYTVSSVTSVTMQRKQRNERNQRDRSHRQRNKRTMKNMQPSRPDQGSCLSLRPMPRCIPGVLFFSDATPSAHLHEKTPTRMEVALLVVIDVSSLITGSMGEKLASRLPSIAQRHESCLHHCDVRTSHCFTQPKPPKKTLNQY